MTGASPSGKTTIAKHMQILFGDGFTKTDRLGWREIIVEILINAFKDARHEVVLSELADEVDLGCAAVHSARFFTINLKS